MSGETRPEEPLPPEARGTSARELWALALPAMVAFAAEPLFLLCDSAMVARLGTAHLAALGVSNTVLGVAVWLFNFLVYGTTSEVARRFGRGEKHEIGEYLVQALAMAAGFGAVLAVLGVAGAEAAHRLMGAAPEVAAPGAEYFRIRALGGPAVLAALAATGALRGLQNTRGPMVVSLCTVTLNLGLDYALIFGVGDLVPALGIRGAAIATLVAEWTWAAASVALLFSPRYRAYRPARLAFDPKAARRTLAAGGDLMQRTAMLLALYATAASLAARTGTPTIAAHEIVLKMWYLTALVADGLAVAGQAVVGRELGAGRAGSAREAGAILIRWGLALGALSAALLWLLRPLWLDLFDPAEGVRAQARAASWWIIALQPASAIVFVLDGVLIGAGEFRYLKRAMFAACVLAYLPLALAAYGLGWGLVGFWGAIAAATLVRFATNLGRFRGAAWTHGKG